MNPPVRVSFVPRSLIRFGLWLACFLLIGSTGKSEEDSRNEPDYWAFQPLAHPSIPGTRARDWVRNPIDSFVLDRLEKAEIDPAPEADRRTLIRRASLDLLGIPPTAAEVSAFVNDPRPDAYERLIDRLLESPRYGERYARHWLDLVRYADSDGYKSDVLRPNAWRYRDYVIESFNSDKSYSRFVEEQIAGDELYPNSDDAKRATGYLRLWPYEDNQPDMGRHWGAILDDITDVSGDVFLGLSMKCARCHDHKFDPITQEDYYSFQAFFAAISPWEEAYLGGPDEEREYESKLAVWKEMTVGIREGIEKIEKLAYKKGWEAAFAKLPPYIQEIVMREERTPYEEQLARFADKLIAWRTSKDIGKNVPKERLDEWKALKTELSEYDRFKPKEREQVASVRDVGGVPPKTYIEAKGTEVEVSPGYLSVLNLAKPTIHPIPGNANTTGRRSTLAKWLTDSSNSISARVMANRLWQWHFGSGIVASSNDFGSLGEPPTHPELLDWLAQTFVDEGWSFKSMHRLIMTSSTYRQSSVREDERTERIDPDNRLLWRMPVRRMDAEQIRDSMLLVSGEIDLFMGGPGVPEEESARRSIYVVNKRNKLRTMMNSFDTPDLHNSCHQRDVTTTPLQALNMINGEWVLSRAESFAKSLLDRESDGLEERVVTAYEIALGRSPEVEEIQLVQSFMSGSTNLESWTDFCHILLNTNEFVYIN